MRSRDDYPLVYVESVTVQPGFVKEVSEWPARFDPAICQGFDAPRERSVDGTVECGIEVVEWYAEHAAHQPRRFVAGRPCPVSEGEPCRREAARDSAPLVPDGERRVRRPTLGAGQTRSLSSTPR